MKLFETSSNVPYFEKYCPLNKKELAEGLNNGSIEQIIEQECQIFT